MKKILCFFICIIFVQNIVFAQTVYDDNYVENQNYIEGKKYLKNSQYSSAINEFKKVVKADIDKADKKLDIKKFLDGEKRWRKRF